MAKREALYFAVVLSMNNERDIVVLKRDVENQSFLDSK